MTVEQIKQEICEVGHRLYAHGFVAANDGNISVKVGENEFYCTPTGVSKGSLTPDMIIKIDAEGNKIEGNLNPSSEIKMHLRVFRERPDVNAVVHAHPPVATAFTVAGIPLDRYILPEAVLTIGDVPTCYAFYHGNSRFLNALYSRARCFYAQKSRCSYSWQHPHARFFYHGRG